MGSDTYSKLLGNLWVAGGDRGQPLASAPGALWSTHLAALQRGRGRWGERPSRGGCSLGRSLDTMSMHPEEEMRVSWQPLALQSEEAQDPVHFPRS